MKKYTFKYAKETVDIELNENQVIRELIGKEIPPITDIKKSVYDSLDNPIEHIPFSKWILKGDKVCIVVSDMSRFWMRQDLIIPHVVSYLNEVCQIEYKDMIILIANGTHEGGDENELRTLVTDDVFEKIKVINHDCKANDLYYIGTTKRGTVVKINKEAAIRKTICIGAATHHVMAGFGGGRKSILPGIASLEAINQNHSHSLDPLEKKSNPLIGNAVLLDNPLNEDMLEAAGMVKDLYILNAVMNADMKLAYLFSGHYEKSWLKACKAAQDCYEVPITELADVVITSCGGFPKDMSLYQGSKTIDNVETGLKLGGTMVVLMECIEGGGPSEYFDWLKPLKEEVLDETLRANFTIPGYVFYLNCEQAQRYNIVLLSKLNKEDAKTMGINVYSDINTLLENIDLKDKSIYVIKNGSTVIPRIQK